MRTALAWTLFKTLTEQAGTMKEIAAAPFVRGGSRQGKAIHLNRLDNTLAIDVQRLPEGSSVVNNPNYLLPLM
jgi:hypothetical protein